MGEGLAKSLASLSQQERDQVSKQELTSEHWSYPERHEATSEEIRTWYQTFQGYCWGGEFRMGGQSVSFPSRLFHLVREL